MTKSDLDDSVKRQIETAIREAVHEERERCALLCEGLARVHRNGAKRSREKGSYTERTIWPPFRKRVFVLPSYERTARVQDEIAHELVLMARGCRSGWDPRHIPDETETADIPRMTEAELMAGLDLMSGLHG